MVVTHPHFINHTCGKRFFQFRIGGKFFMKPLMLANMWMRERECSGGKEATHGRQYVNRKGG